jgi:hypothetical protein
MNRWRIRDEGNRYEKFRPCLHFEGVYTSGIGAISVENLKAGWWIEVRRLQVFRVIVASVEVR